MSRDANDKLVKAVGEAVGPNEHKSENPPLLWTESWTPGPWEIVPYGAGDSLVIHASPNRRICFMATPGSEEQAWPHIQANARLIASAPALAEALERAGGAMEFARDKLGIVGPGDGRDRKADADDPCGLLGAIDQARAALSLSRSGG